MSVAIKGNYRYFGLAKVNQVKFIEEIAKPAPLNISQVGCIKRRKY